jgi:hypothetical protein
VNGINASAIAPPRIAFELAGRSAGHEHARNNAGTRRRGRGLRIADRVADQHADHRPADPRHVEKPAGSEQTRTSKPAALQRDRPGLVDDQLRLEQPPPRGASNEDATEMPIACSARSASGRDDRRRRRAAGVQERGDATAPPPNVVADMTIGAFVPMPAVRARTPNESAKAKDATPMGAIARAPSR